MEFFTEAINILKASVIALGAGLSVRGVVNLLEGYGNDNSGGKSQGNSHQKMGKELMTQADLAVMDNSKFILQLRGEKPFQSDKYDIRKHPYYQYLSDLDPSKAFSIEKEILLNLKVGREQFMDVYELGSVTGA